MHRLAVSAKRKVLLNPKTVAIYCSAIFFTFLLAYHHRLGQENDTEIHSLRLIRMRTAIGENGSVAKNSKNLNLLPEEQLEAPPIESKGDFNTFDLFKSAVMGGQTLPRKTKKHQKLKVHVLPFTHVDPGWLQTFESYTKSTNQILDNMHSFMMENEKMRFMWAEFVFFERWWSLKSDDVKRDVRKLVSSGRLELATGSWVMTDEANPYFPVSVDNIIEGFQFINTHFGIKPTTMWSNDPFGYSNSVPYLFRKSGVQRQVINRIHHTLKQNLQNQQAIPFKWRQFFDQHGKNDVLTQVLPYTHYDILNSCGSSASVCCEFDFKRITHWSCPGPKPVNIDKHNVKSKAEKLVAEIEKMSEMYRAPVILMMHGDDFRFDMIEEWHQQHDNFLPVFEEINKGDRMEIGFGTFNDYFNDMEKWNSEHPSEAPPTLTGDFFPYMCALGDYWTGYFTTRPFYKRQGRLLHSLIRNADVMLSMRRSTLKQKKINANIQFLEEARRNLSLFQHHDAITGTSKVSVMDDYSELLHKSILSTKSVLEELMKGDLDLYPRVHDGVEIKKLLAFKERTAPREVKIFNSQLFAVTDVFELRTDLGAELRVLINGSVVAAQVEPYFVKGKVDKESVLVLFSATIPPLSMIKVTIEKGDSAGKTEVVKMTSSNSTWSSELLGGSWKVSTSSASELFMETPFLKSFHDPATGALRKVIKLGSASTFPCEQTWLKYTDAAGGAYLMRLHTNPKDLTPQFQWLKASGPIRESIFQANDMVFQRMSLKNVKGPAGEQLDVSMSIDISEHRNTELMTRFSTNFDNVTTFTDSVGLQLIRREFYKAPVQNNYYPMPTAAVLESEEQRISIVSNVEHGARFLENGTLEINIDRILNQDDGKGLGSSSDSIPIDLHPVEQHFKLIFDTITSHQTHYSTHTLAAQQAVQSVIYPSIIVESQKIEDDVEEVAEDSGLLFPCDIQLLTVRPLSVGESELAVFYRHATVNVQGEEKKASNCGANLKTSLMHFLIRLGVHRVQRTDLSGVTAIGGMEKVENLKDIELNVFDFFTIVLYR